MYSLSIMNLNLKNDILAHEVWIYLYHLPHTLYCSLPHFSTPLLHSSDVVILKNYFSFQMKFLGFDCVIQQHCTAASHYCFAQV